MDKEYYYKKKFKFSKSNDSYVFQLKKRNWKWLWLLLLLPLLLLFVRCEKSIEIETIDAVSKMGIPDVNVTIDYTAHYLYKDGRLFANDDIHRELKTDENGNCTFTDLPCSIFSYIFYAFSTIHYTATENCHSLIDAPAKSIFHYTWNKTLKMSPKTTDIDLTVVDRETLELLAGATVIYKYELSGQSFSDSLKTSAAGTCKMENVPECGIITLSKVGCYGYADTTNVIINVPEVLMSPDSARAKLTPLKQRFTYFVKNKFTKEPIPGAKVEVTLTTGNNVLRGQSTTNVDGKGFGVYEDAFVLANVDLKASKIHYKDGSLEKKYTVEEFAALPDSSRTIFLEPEPYMEQFQNVDSITGAPILGVNNEIEINSISGSNETLSEISNRNGVFYVKAMEGDHIHINSEKSPYYYPKETDIKSFSKGEIIKMQPKMTDLTFRTIDGETNELLPQCSLSISTSKSNITQPTSSGNGVFTIKNVFVGENITIVASKTGYSTNSDKVRNAEVLELMNATQDRRDIPLFVVLPPCDAGDQGQNDVKAGTVSQPQSYNMGANHGTFDITYDTGTSCTDCIDIYNHKPGEDYLSGHKIWSSGQVATGNPQRATVSFSYGSVITVVVTTGPSDGSLWNYHITCPY